MFVFWVGWARWLGGFDVDRDEFRDDEEVKKPVRTRIVASLIVRVEEDGEEEEEEEERVVVRDVGFACSVDRYFSGEDEINGSLK